MNRHLSILLLCMIQAMPSLHAAGISVDSGLTPPQDRWILRSQVRLTGRESINPGGPHMDALMFPVVLAYGLRSDVTIFLRQALARREMASMKQSGFGDTSIMAKYKAFRVNSRSYVFGVAPTLGLEMPTGESNLGSDTWDLRPGMFFTFRHGLWDEDLVVAYSWNGIAGKNSLGIKPGNQLDVNFAVARQFGLNNDYSATLAPVLEVAYENVFRSDINGLELSNTGERILYFSPGIKLTVNSLVLEALWQYPHWQRQNGNLAQRKDTILFGTRFMF